MPKHTLDIPAALSARVYDAFAAAYGYQATRPHPTDPTKTIPNPQTKADHFEAQLLAHVQAVVESVEAPAAAETARVAQRDKVRAEVRPTASRG